MILSGDSAQTDIGNSGFADAFARLENIKGIEVIHFRDEDIVRSEMCKKVILAYKN